MIRSGIYMILNLLNGKRYVGSAVNLEKRRRDHFCKLRKGTHGNSHLQNAFNKYGDDAFGRVVLEYVENLEMLLSRENLYLKMFWPTGLLYNKCPVAGSSLGCRWEWTEESKHRSSEAQKGKCLSVKTKQKIGRISVMWWSDEEYIQKQREAHTGYCRSVESKQKQSKTMLKLYADPKFRQAHIEACNSAEAKRKNSEAHVGKPSGFKGKHHTAETNQKNSKSTSKLWADERFIQKQRDTNPMLWNSETGDRAPFYGREHSTETKKKISISLKKYWARRKRAEHLLVLIQLVGVLQKQMGSLIAAA